MMRYHPPPMLLPFAAALAVSGAALAQECRPVRNGPVPRVRPQLESAAFWLERWGPAADTRLLDADAVRALDARLEQEGARPPDLTIEGGMTIRDARHRLAAYVADAAAGVLAPAPEALAEARAVVDGFRSGGAVRVVARPGHLRCIPTAKGLFRSPVDPEFDRNQCSGLHFGEPVREMGRSGDWSYVRTESGSGWVFTQLLGPPLTHEESARYSRTALQEAQFIVADSPPFRLGTRFPRVGTQILPPEGGRPVQAPAASHHGPLPFTRREVFELAFTEYGEPYGWGDVNGHRDCSRLILDLLAPFGLGLGRNSFTQSQIGSEVLAVAALDDSAKRRAIVEAGTRGVLLLYFPGHIMLYLGHLDGHPWALSALAEFVEPCAEGGEVIHRVDRVTVSDLELGRGTSRRAFIERITALVVLGR